MDLFPPFVAVMAGAATSFFGGSWLLKMLENKRPDTPDQPAGPKKSDL